MDTYGQIYQILDKYGLTKEEELNCNRANYKKVNRELINRLNREYAQRRKLRSP